MPYEIILPLQIWAFAFYSIGYMTLNIPLHSLYNTVLFPFVVYSVRITHLLISLHCTSIIKPCSLRKCILNSVSSLVFLVALYLACFGTCKSTFQTLLLVLRHSRISLLCPISYPLRPMAVTKYLKHCWQMT